MYDVDHRDRGEKKKHTQAQNSFRCSDFAAFGRNPYSQLSCAPV